MKNIRYHYSLVIFKVLFYLVKSYGASKREIINDLKIHPRTLMRIIDVLEALNIPIIREYDYNTETKHAVRCYRIPRGWAKDFIKFHGL